MYRRILGLAILFSSVLPAHAAADWLVSPYIGARFAAQVTSVLGVEGATRTKSMFGTSFGWLSNGVFGAEADVAFVPGFFSRFGTISNSRVTTVMGNVIVALPMAKTQYGLRPYATAGAGYMRGRAASGEGTFEFEALGPDVFAMNLGGGAIGPLTDRTSARFDLRYFTNLGGDADVATSPGTDFELSFWRVTAGLSFRF